MRRAPCQPEALRIHLTRLSTEGLVPRHGEVRRAHQMLNAALPGRGDIPAFTPAEAGTRLSDPGGMQG